MLLNFAELNKRKGLNFSRSQIWRLERIGHFPRRILISANAARWDEAEIDAYINARKAARTPPPKSRPFRRVKRRA